MFRLLVIPRFEKVWLVYKTLCQRLSNPEGFYLRYHIIMLPGDHLVMGSNNLVFNLQQQKHAIILLFMTIVRTCSLSNM